MNTYMLGYVNKYTVFDQKVVGGQFDRVKGHLKTSICLTLLLNPGHISLK